MSPPRRPAMLAAVWLATALSLAAAPGASRPNLVFILADDLGYGEVSFNGQTRYRTPNIDRIAHEGIAFRHAYAGRRSARRRATRS